MRKRIFGRGLEVLEAGFELHEANESPVRRFVYWHYGRFLLTIGDHR